ncbi:MAG: hypothetical protein MZU79_03935 [Anaerotruncus sp.]|nr:hypothetical protein [Anaerotruncus sp.]
MQPGATADRNITVKATQLFGSITFAGEHISGGRDNNGKSTATATPSGLAVTFSSLTTSVCTTGGTNGRTVTGVNAGTCIIAANQAGNANYGPAQTVTGNITVGKAIATVTLSNLNRTFTGSPLYPTATTNPEVLSIPL